jgi:hypothetical protein
MASKPGIAWLLHSMHVLMSVNADSYLCLPVGRVEVVRAVHLPVPQADPRGHPYQGRHTISFLEHPAQKTAQLACMNFKCIWLGPWGGHNLTGT